MKNIEITINGHNYTLACDNGQESHVEQLAEEVSMRAVQLAAGMGGATETMVLVMTCLMLADELYESRQEAGALHEHLAMMKAAGLEPTALPSEPDAYPAQSMLALAMNEMADHIDRMAGALKGTS